MAKPIKLPRKSAALVKKDYQIFDTRQINAFWQKTPEKFTHERDGRGGKKFKYVTGAYVKSQLDRIFGYNWSFETKSHEIQGKFIVVNGRLTAHVPYPKSDGFAFHSIIKEDFGRSKIKTEQGSSNPVDIGDDFKAAATDALKRCAAQFGIARDIYSAGEIKEIQFVDEEILQEQSAQEKMAELDREVENRLEDDGDPYEVSG